ncbi:MAG: hypothetical protein A2Z25_14610 [Planctomycetes bacterium RBG_16_55_9]|nr:MAG: hypothetical protein A2Z25_14610 [Planctomycetes bacterium RBG_16_55_9]
MDVRILAGHIETVSIGLGHKISGAIATLFSEESGNFELVARDGVDTAAASELLSEKRGDGLMVEALVQADQESVWVGTMPVFVEYVDGRFCYHPIDPGKIQVLFEEAIEANGFTRPTNRRDIEDATCVVIGTGSLDDNTNNFLAIFGRSTLYPMGRYVSFRSSGDGRSIPKPWDKNSYDWLDNGEIANPLSVYADAHPDMDLPEYPIAIIHSGLVRRDTLFPVSDSLLCEALEADVAASHIRATSGDNAKGTRVLEKSEAGGPQPIPKHLTGEVLLESGQKLTQLNSDAGAPKIAWELLQEEMVAVGLGYTVPDFYVSSKDHTVEAASGTALIVRSGQLEKLRKRRTVLNAPAVKKIFEIEKALISLMSDEDASTIALLESCEQNWNPGEPASTEREIDRIAVVERLLATGLYDTIEAIRVAYALRSEDEAIDKYEQLKTRRKKFPPLNVDGDTDTDVNGDTDTDSDDEADGEEELA